MTSKINSGHGGNLRELAAKGGIPLARLIDFSANINPLGPPEFLRPVLSRSVELLCHYPDPDYSELVAAISAQFQVEPGQVLVGNGSTEILYALPRALGLKRAIVPSPAYIDYRRAAEMAGMAVETVILAEEDDFQVDWPALESRLRGQELVILGHPNNPTGTLLDEEKLLAAVRRHPATLFLIDEAFADFTRPCHSLVGAPGRSPANLLIIRSMTKFYAIPGLRLGFGLAPTELAAAVRPFLLPWSVNTLALAVGAACLADAEYAQASRALTHALRLELQAGLAAIPGLKHFPSGANYLLLKLTGPELSAPRLGEKLLQRGLAIRVCANYEGLDERFFRIAVRTKEENQKLLDTLHELLAPRPRASRPRPTPALMFQGTSSDAGKSILTAALCRIMFQDGLRVAPFKAQNMSLNSFVTHHGEEMGRAQVVQAQACRLDPDVRMNPVLLKPSSEVGSQIIVNGRPVANMSVDQYLVYKPQAWLAAQKAYDSLAGENQVMILEGAGSPAEVNLKRHDIVNMRMAQHAQAQVLLVGDIDRGGVFASFIGTMEVMAEWERRLVAGFIVNRFRGQESLLQDAFAYTTRHTGRPVLGVIPYLRDLGLPEEDSVGFKKGLYDSKPPAFPHVELALIDLPHISNFTDFEPFLAEPDVHLRIIRNLAEIEDTAPDAILLPGSKNTLHDLGYLKSSGLGAKIVQLAGGGRTEIVGICGGLQMLGKTISDPETIECGGQAEGLGLLALATTMAAEKTLCRREARHCQSGLAVHGYEIHHGQSPSPDQPALLQADGRPDGACSENGLVWGTYLHGLFDADPFRHWFINRLRQRRGLPAHDGGRASYDLEPAFDRLAATVRGRLDMNNIYRMLRL